MIHRITWDEYKELVTKYNLEPNSYNTGFRPNGEPEQHSLPFVKKYGKYQGCRCAVFSECYGARVRKDLDNWYTWLLTKEDMEEALIEMFKFLKEEQMKDKLETLETDFV